MGERTHIMCMYICRMWFPS